MRYKKKDVYVHRFLIEIVNKPSGPFIATCLCGTAFCVNPTHWLVSPAPGTSFTPEDEPTDITVVQPASDPEDQKNTIGFDDEPWPEDEVEQMIDYYLCRNPGPLDPNHDLLMDIPVAQLKSVVLKMGQGHRIVDD